ncbi:MAG: hypothetical protein LLF92_04830 [Planctomycetaceae bacterium]|nr:hypothetical protein [Planctomycetaceae bacterium]
MKRRFTIRKRIERGIMKSHWIILALVVVGAIGFGLFKCNHKSTVSPEAELCEILYQVD